MTPEQLAEIRQWDAQKFANWSGCRLLLAEYDRLTEEAAFLRDKVNILEDEVTRRGCGEPFDWRNVR